MGEDTQRMFTTPINHSSGAAIAPPSYVCLLITTQFRFQDHVCNHTQLLDKTACFLRPQRLYFSSVAAGQDNILLMVNICVDG